MRFRNFMAPAIMLALASAAAAQTPTYPQPATPRSDPSSPQPTTQPGVPASQTPINPPSTPASGQAWQQQNQYGQNQQPQGDQGGMRRGPEMTVVQSHLDTVLQGVSLTYSQYKRIDSTAMQQLASAGFGRGRMMGGRDGMGRDGRSNNTNCGVNGRDTTGSNNMPGQTGVNSNCPQNQSGTPGDHSGYPRSDSTRSATSYPSSQNGQYDRDGDRGMGRMGMGHDSLSTSDRSRLMPVLDQIDSAIRPILSTAQQRTFDRNVNSWKRNHATATN